ncbi:MAG: hypothetical protein H8D78_10810 [Chloroflexi bacterium]|nr:hypothetical protein [Chloroflexota bacterium]
MAWPTDYNDYTVFEDVDPEVDDSGTDLSAAELNKFSNGLYALEHYAGPGIQGAYDTLAARLTAEFGTLSGLDADFAVEHNADGTHSAITATTLVVSGNINPEADGTRSLGTQTTAQWANVWSDLYNGADYSYLNGWRTLEAEKYAGYPAGLAIGNEGFANGQVTERMADGLRPLFAVTEGFIEYAGVRITPQQWARLVG